MKTFKIAFFISALSLSMGLNAQIAMADNQLKPTDNSLNSAKKSMKSDVPPKGVKESETVYVS